MSEGFARHFNNLVVGEPELQALQILSQVIDDSEFDEMARYRIAAWFSSYAIRKRKFVKITPIEKTAQSFAADEYEKRKKEKT